MLMTFKEIFQLSNFFQKIKLDRSEENQAIDEELKRDSFDDDNVDKKFSGNEWNQEYELIYLSYVLEK
jgi:hypothetical protein